MFIHAEHKNTTVNALSKCFLFIKIKIAATIKIIPETKVLIKQKIKVKREEK